MTNYQPINCDYYDELILLILRKQKCRIAYWDAANCQINIEDYLEDIYAKQGEEFLRLKNYDEIRLDRLISVAGIAPPVAGIAPPNAE